MRRGRTTGHENGFQQREIVAVKGSVFVVQAFVMAIAWRSSSLCDDIDPAQETDPRR